ncbi:hypothetical protein AVEN_24318-1 [Araneus ventricosus]|uniref:Uncharacterized protein n=1 Tax=Araneus ventricosus TaxID=182803 RepID=A0A4Y2NF77_ARAVE|nr:hypothetical protein AVEN_24318-1 [Araneus ventricosus]
MAYSASIFGLFGISRTLSGSFPGFSIVPLVLSATWVYEFELMVVVFPQISFNFTTDSTHHFLMNPFHPKCSLSSQSFNCVLSLLKSGLTTVIFPFKQQQPCLHVS